MSDPRDTQTVGNPPIDSEVSVIGYSIQYGFGHISGPNTDTFQIKVFIADARKLPDGQNYQNELYILRDGLYPKLPEAFQFPNGIIRFFAYESQLPAVLTMLSTSGALWLRTRGGKVNLIAGQRVIKP